MKEEELDIKLEPENASRRIGHTLGRLRVQKDPDTSNRAWQVSLQDLLRLSISFGLLSPSPTKSDENPKESTTADAESPSPNAGDAEDAGNACPPDEPAVPEAEEAASEAFPDKAREHGDQDTGSFNCEMGSQGKPYDEPAACDVEKTTSATFENGAQEEVF